MPRILLGGPWVPYHLPRAPMGRVPCQCMVYGLLVFFDEWYGGTYAYKNNTGTKRVNKHKRLYRGEIEWVTCPLLPPL